MGILDAFDSPDFLGRVLGLGGGGDGEGWDQVWNKSHGPVTQSFRTPQAQQRAPESGSFPIGPDGGIPLPRPRTGYTTDMPMPPPNPRYDRLADAFGPPQPPAMGAASFDEAGFTGGALRDPALPPGGGIGSDAARVPGQPGNLAQTGGIGSDAARVPNQPGNFYPAGPSDNPADYADLRDAFGPSYPVPGQPQPGRGASAQGRQGENGLPTDKPMNGSGIYTGPAEIPGFGLMHDGAQLPPGATPTEGRAPPQAAAPGQPPRTMLPPITVTPPPAQRPPMPPLPPGGGPDTVNQSGGLAAAFGVDPNRIQATQQQQRARQIMQSVGAGLTATGKMPSGATAGQSFAAGAGASLEGMAGAQDKQEKDNFDRSSTAFKDMMIAKNSDDLAGYRAAQSKYLAARADSLRQMTAAGGAGSKAWMNTPQGRVIQADSEVLKYRDQIRKTAEANAKQTGMPVDETAIEKRAEEYRARIYKSRGIDPKQAEKIRSQGESQDNPFDTKGMTAEQFHGQVPMGAWFKDQKGILRQRTVPPPGSENRATPGAGSATNYDDQAAMTDAAA